MNPSNARRPLAPTPRKLLRELVEASPRPLTAGQVAERIEADPDKFSYASYRQHIKTLRRAFAAVDADFLDCCNRGEGIVTFGDEGAYCWVAPGKSK
jgi:two-component system OmpR family response regulator